jgi:hypothetical protein
MYREVREEYMVKKALQRALHLKVTKLKEKNAPAHALKECVLFFFLW